MVCINQPNGVCHHFIFTFFVWLENKISKIHWFPNRFHVQVTSGPVPVYKFERTDAPETGKVKYDYISPGHVIKAPGVTLRYCISFLWSMKYWLLIVKQLLKPNFTDSVWIGVLFLINLFIFKYYLITKFHLAFLLSKNGSHFLKPLIFEFSALGGRGCGGII